MAIFFDEISLSRWAINFNPLRKSSGSLYPGWDATFITDSLGTSTWNYEGWQGHVYDTDGGE